MAKISYDFNKLSVSEKGVKALAKTFEKKGTPTVAVEVLETVKKTSGMKYKEVVFTFADSQQVTARISEKGGIFQVLINGKVKPIKNQDDDDKAVVEIIDSLDAGRKAFQKKLEARAMDVPAKEKATTASIEKMLKEKLGVLQESVANLERELSEIKESGVGVAGNGSQTANSPTPQVTVNDDKRDENSVFSSASSIVILWSEGSPDENIKISSFEELQKWFKNTYPESDMRGSGYSKNKIHIVLTNGYGQQTEIIERVDVGGDDGDFNPYSEHIKTYLSKIPSIKIYPSIVIKDNESAVSTPQAQGGDMPQPTDKTALELAEEWTKSLKSAMQRTHARSKLTSESSMIKGVTNAEWIKMQVDAGKEVFKLRIDGYEVTKTEFDFALHLLSLKNGTTAPTVAPTVAPEPTQQPTVSSNLNSIIAGIRTKIHSGGLGVFDVEQDQHEKYVVMRATRPLVGTDTMEAPRLSGGGFWALIDKSNEFAASNAETNRKLDAEIYISVKNDDELNKVALYFQKDSKYFEKRTEAMADPSFNEKYGKQFRDLSFNKRDISYAEMMEAIEWAKSYTYTPSKQAPSKQARPKFEPDGNEYLVWGIKNGDKYESIIEERILSRGEAEWVENEAKKLGVSNTRISIFKMEKPDFTKTLDSRVKPKPTVAPTVAPEPTQQPTEDKEVTEAKEFLQSVIDKSIDFEKEDADVLLDRMNAIGEKFIENKEIYDLLDNASKIYGDWMMVQAKSMMGV